MIILGYWMPFFTSVNYEFEEVGVSGRASERGRERARAVNITSVLTSNWH